MGYGLTDTSLEFRESAPARLPRRSAFDIYAVRIIDIAIAGAAILFFLPLIALIVLAIRLTQGGPVLFAHRRIGRDGLSFSCLKFRTMVGDADSRLQQLLASDPLALAEWTINRKLRNDPRITWFGRFLRKSSFDEIPQLFNVLRGEMSIVGPRPIVAEETILYGGYLPYYCSVKPGITGFWQISGRSNLSFRKRVAMDVIYARKKSVVWDLKILAMTIPVVLMARGSC